MAAKHNTAKKQHSQVQQKIKTKGKAEQKRTKQRNKKITLISPTHYFPDHHKPSANKLLLRQPATQTSNKTTPGKFVNK